MRNVHDKGKVALFHSRWAMNYLAGPLTRKQIEVLMSDKRAGLMVDTTPDTPTSTATSSAPNAAAATPTTTSAVPKGYNTSKPAVNADEYFLPVQLSTSDAIRQWEATERGRADDLDAATLVYDPVLLAQAEVRYEDKKSGVRVDRLYAFHVIDPETTGFIQWDEYSAPAVNPRDLDTQVRQEGAYGDVPVVMSDSSRLKELERDLVDQIYKDYSLKLPYQALLEVVGNPDEDPSVFEAAVRQAAREQRDAEFDKLTERFEKQLDRLGDKLKKKETELEKDKRKASTGDQDLLTTGLSGAFAVLTGRSATSAMSRVGRKFGRRGELKAEVETTERELQDMQNEQEQLRAEFEEETQALEEKWNAELSNTSEKEVSPYKKDIRMSVFGLGWLPYYAFTSDGRMEFAPAFQTNADDEGA